MHAFERPALALLGVLVLGSCDEVSPGVAPPADRFAFPNGLLLDPRVSSEALAECSDENPCAMGLCASGQCRMPARWMLVGNANSDLRYNAASLVPVDLDLFWAALDGEILPAGSKVSTDYTWKVENDVKVGVPCDTPCRRIANLPQVVECEERCFVTREEETAFYGNFPGPITPWVKPDEVATATLLIPVRGDPSITWFTLRGGLDGADDLEIDCGEGDDERTACDDRHRLRFLRNDPDANRLAREPFRVHVSAQPDLPYAYVSHGIVGSRDPDFTLIALEGLAVDGDGLPVIVDDRLIFTSNIANGGMGIAQRPCDVASGNAPASSLGCTRPRVYGVVRWNRSLQVATTIRHEPIGEQFCAGPEDLDLIGAINCDPQLEYVRGVSAGGISTESVNTSLSQPILGDIAFSAAGNELYVVQSHPGGLLRIDTSIGENGEPRDIPVAQVEVCARPTSLALYEDGQSRLGLVTCYRSGELFIVDLASFAVVGLARAGSGPDAMAVDLAREVVYVANSLDGTISVIDMSPSRTTRFTELARLGLQEPYTG